MSSFLPCIFNCHRFALYCLWMKCDLHGYMYIVLIAYWTVRHPRYPRLWSTKYHHRTHLGLQPVLRFTGVRRVDVISTLPAEPNLDFAYRILDFAWRILELDPGPWFWILHLDLKTAPGLGYRTSTWKRHLDLDTAPRLENGTGTWILHLDLDTAPGLGYRTEPGLCNWIVDRTWTWDIDYWIESSTDAS